MDAIHGTGMATRLSGYSRPFPGHPPPRGFASMTTTMAADTERLGDVLIREGLLTRAKCDQALAEQRSSGHRLGYVLVKLGLVPELEITKMLARQYRMPAVDLSRFEVDPKILKLIPADLADEARRAAAQARGPHADGGDGRPDQPSGCSTTSSSSPATTSSRSRRGVHAAQRSSRSTTSRRTTSSCRPSSRTWRGWTSDVEVVEEQEDEAATQAQIDDAPVVKLINGLLTDAVQPGRHRHPHRAASSTSSGCATASTARCSR